MELKINSPKYGEFTVLYDKCDEDKIKSNTWHIKHGYNTIYAMTHKGERGQKVFLHRLITSVSNSYTVDHINGNGLDNRRCNLRICTNHENQFNKSKKTNRNYTSKYKGVSWSKRDKTWYAFIRKNKKTLNLGRYEKQSDAALVYNGAAKFLHGEFANLNRLETC